MPGTITSAETKAWICTADNCCNPAPEPQPIKDIKVEGNNKKFTDACPSQAHWKLCAFPEEYKYSSAAFYEKGINEFGFISHYLG